MRFPRRAAALAGIMAGAALAIFAAARLLLAPATVATVAVAEATIPTRVTGTGNLQARIAVTLGARITASVTSVGADQGDRVSRGQLLATLDDRDLGARRAAAEAQRETVSRNASAALANVAKAEAELDLARSRHGHEERLYRTAFVSQTAMDSSTTALRAAEAALASARAAFAARESEIRQVTAEGRYAEAVLSHTRITAPIDGVVVQRAAEAGTTVVPGTAIFRLVDPATLWIAVRVDESVVGKVATDMKATIRLRTGEVLPGRVARISRQADAAARELEVDVAFDSPPARFAIDQEASVDIHAGEERGVAVPLSALVSSGGRRGVFVVRDGRAQFLPLATGAADSERVIARTALVAGDVVVADPGRLKSGARIRATAQGH